MPPSFARPAALLVLAAIGRSVAFVPSRPAVSSAHSSGRNVGVVVLHTSTTAASTSGKKGNRWKRNVSLGMVANSVLENALEEDLLQL